jgi:tetratricopeptide (TPR) repeat protein
MDCSAAVQGTFFRSCVHYPKNADRSHRTTEEIMGSHLDYEINKELGECYLFMGELDRAEEYYNKAVGSNGVHPEPYLGLATIAVQRGDLEQAIGLYKKAADIDQNDKALAGMGLIELEQGAYDKAFDHLRLALEKNPSNMIALFGIVQAGHALGRLEEVVPLMTASLEMNQTNREVRFSLAGCLAGLGRKEEASAQLELLLAQDPQHAAAQELLLTLR